MEGGETPSSSMDVSMTHVNLEDVFGSKSHDDILDLSCQGLEKLGRAAPDFVLNTTTRRISNKEASTKSHT